MCAEPTGRGAHLSRRHILALAAGTVAAGALGPGPVRAAGPVKPARDPDQVLSALFEGNRRFVEGRAEGPRRRPEDWARLAEGQSPGAVIVGCSDSRVPPEIVFDQGVGDL